MKNFIKNNSSFLSAFVTYVICLAIALFLGGESPLMVNAFICIGGAVVLAWAVSMAAKFVRNYRMDTKALTLAGIEKVFQSRGYAPKKDSKDQIMFKYSVPDLTWRLRYDEETKKLTVALAFQFEDMEKVRIAQEATNAVMPNNKMVRMYMKPVNETLFFFISVENFLTRQSDFDRFIESYLEIMVKALNEHDACCRKIVEEKSKEPEAARIGFVSPMREKINAFDKENPDATEAERRSFIESIRK